MYKPNNEKKQKDFFYTNVLYEHNLLPYKST